LADQIEVKRRLAAIFAADVEGYSRLMGADEVATLDALTVRREILDGRKSSVQSIFFIGGMHGNAKRPAWRTLGPERCTKAKWGAQLALGYGVDRDYG
jgi:hypothetical protein